MPGTPASEGLILANCRVVTLDPARPAAAAVGMRSGRVAAVGTLEEVRAAVAGARELDLAGAVVFPGLVDAHGHLKMLGDRMRQLDLGAARTETEVADLVRARAATIPPGEWIVGRGWDQNRFAGGRLPGRSALDAAAPDHPVFLERVDGHAAWVNSRALEMAGMLRDAASPQGGRVVCDSRGTPTGVLIDAAVRPVAARIPPESEAQLEQWVLRACQRCASFGLTGVHDAGIDLRVWSALERLASRGELPIRVYGMAWSDAPDLDRLLEAGPRVGLLDGMLTLRAVKFMLDGSLGSSGAALFADYADAPGERGLLIDPEGFARKAPELAARGFQVAVHAIGDRAAALALDVLERTGSGLADPRFRLEHAQLLRPADLGRLATAGIVGSVQPSHLASDARWVERRLGKDRAARAYPWRSLLSAGARLAFGSDFPIEPPDPRRGLHAALTRQTPDGWPEGGWHAEESLTAMQALAGFTSGAAWAAFEEGEGGRISVGCRADLSVFDTDLLTAPADRILEARPLATIVRGTVVCSALC